MPDNDLTMSQLGLGKHHEEYKLARHDMNDKGRFKLSNFMAHGFSITSPIVRLTMIERDGEVLMIDRRGTVYKADKCIG